MIKDLRIENILFIDIETVPAAPSFNEMPEILRKLWERKAETISRKEGETADSLFPRAGIYAEFGKVICISAGFYRGGEFRIKSFFGHDEKKILSEFSVLLSGYFSTPDRYICAHNGKEFDFPYLSRRMLINRLPLPAVLDNSGKKPWEVPFLDTMEMWRFGDFKNYTSLELLAAIFGIDNPKDDIGGSEVWKVYWQDDDLERIRMYCQKDVLAIAQLFLCYQQKPQIPSGKVLVVD
jgi:DNA polymerase elongation subunit (family B)